MKKYFFIVNTVAANGASLKIWEMIKQELETKQVNYRSFFTKSERHAVELAKQIANMHHEQIEAIVAVGGDGTISEVINGVMDGSDIPIGYIPAGSANDFSRGYSIPASPLTALRTILMKKKLIKKIDVGRYKLGERTKPSYFVNNLGVGFDAEVSNRANQSRMKKNFNKLRMGSLVYVGILLNLLFKYKTTNVELNIDGQEYHYQDVWFVTISNQPYYGGGMKISPKANPFDGLLNVTVVHHFPPIKLLLLFGTVFFGKHTFFKGVNFHIGKEIHILPETKLPMHADGEYIGTSPVSISIASHKQPLIVSKRK
ncbi:diacylglycerol/lipid kinase family protein [Bacillus sp. PS06]|uniref:diacylglycerol/lipid kinase family protein n=1 Tax=Bacillus sp. PS06 TaxID=2764176 RepID=UPI00177DF8CC|nr:diacylglycerol kinase family protein [Bacillus sp. PS06]MBD8069020.1 diacylglycerol kinase family lipid kinase [Bacillus sp. PS06]